MDDLATLTNLTETTLLKEIQVRYAKDIIYVRHSPAHLPPLLHTARFSRRALCPIQLILRLSFDAFPLSRPLSATSSSP